MSVTGVACGSHQTGPDESKFLLHGFRAASSDNFDFYSINDDTAYAVALKDSKKNVTSTIEIIDEYNGKPVTGIWRYGFANSKASSFVIPDSITVIDYEAFMNSKISTLTIPATVSAIGEGAFYTCKSLNKVSIHNSTTSESSSACSCEEVSEGDTGERIYSTLSLIPSFCFFNCSNLKELVLPQSIEEIGYEAFNGCSSLYSTLAFMNIKAMQQGDPNSNVQVSLTLSDGTEYPLTGVISEADRALSDNTGTLTLKALFDNPNGILLPGMYARVKLTGETVPNAVLVPQRAVQQLLGKSFVMVVNGDGKSEARTVTLGDKVGSYYIIKDGIDASDIVVVEGLSNLQEGRELSVTMVTPEEMGFSLNTDTSLFNPDASTVKK